jgi:DNA mismatch repair protein PMS2|tara:strand:- start:50 stop:898 length:849 start_codon:yes stop_codon:yes gene_type:complete
MHTLANQLQAWRGKDYDEDAAGGFSGASQMEVDEDDDEDTNKATSSEPQHNNTSSSSSTSPQNGKQIPSYGIGDDVRRLSKHDFLKMEIIGQFNLGFILVKLKDDLYILDQHACDEKYNYEELYKNTVVHVQPLIRPTSFEATASEELTIIDYLDIFKKNGFHLTVDHDAAPGRKLKITALPFSKKTTFGINDVHELADLLSACDSSRRNTIRPPKIDAMFASRSCRMSIMVGRALERSEQIKIVTNLATMDQPWNCPHGRPTLQHLVALNKTNVKPVFATK